MKKKILFSLTLFILGSSILLGNIKIKASQLFHIDETIQTKTDGDLDLYHQKGTINGNHQNFYHVDFNPSTNHNIELIAWAVNENGQSGNVKSTIMQMAADYEAKHPGSIVLAGINADYFSMSAGSYDSPFSAQVLEGDVHQVNVFTKDGYSAGVIGIKENNKIISSLTIQRSASMYLEVLDNLEKVIYQTPVKLNQPLITNSTSVYFGNSTNSRINEDLLYVVQNPNYVRPNAFGKGKVSLTTSSYTLSTKEFAIATNDANLIQYLNSNVTIRVQYHPTSDFENCQNIIGYYGQPLKNGQILANGKASEGKAGGPPTQSIMTGINPRTALGIKSDGTIVMGVIDGRQSSIGSVGVTSTELANIYQELGCVDAYMFDGGGSSTLIARIDGKLKLINSPSDGAMRRVTNGLFIVKKANIETTLNSKIEEITENSFKISVRPEDTSVKKIWAIINDNEYLIENNILELKDLKQNSNYIVKFKYEYVDNNETKRMESNELLTIKLKSTMPILKITSSTIENGEDKLKLMIDMKNHQFIEATIAIQGTGTIKRYAIKETTTSLDVEGLTEGITYTITSVLKYKDITTDKVEVLYGEITNLEYPKAIIQPVPEEKGCKAFRSNMLLFLSISIALIGILMVRKKKSL